jgi:hypothetical protein
MVCNFLYKDNDRKETRCAYSSECLINDATKNVNETRIGIKKSITQSFSTKS